MRESRVFGLPIHQCSGFSECSGFVRDCRLSRCSVRVCRLNDIFHSCVFRRYAESEEFLQELKLIPISPCACSHPKNELLKALNSELLSLIHPQFIVCLGAKRPDLQARSIEPQIPRSAGPLSKPIPPTNLLAPELTGALATVIQVGCDKCVALLVREGAEAPHSEHRVPSMTPLCGLEWFSKGHSGTAPTFSSGLCLQGMLQGFGHAKISEAGHSGCLRCWPHQVAAKRANPLPYPNCRRPGRLHFGAALQP